jgi:hypothetical protein
VSLFSGMLICMNFTTKFSRETVVGHVKDVPCVEILHGNTNMLVAELL